MNLAQILDFAYSLGADFGNADDFSFTNQGAQRANCPDRVAAINIIGPRLL
jgi:hypothetical protein